MKSIESIRSTLAAFEKKFGLPAADGSQGGEIWLKTKLGVLSSSNSSKIIAKIDSETRATYMADLVAQVCTGISEEINSRHMDWGKINEDAARSSYEFETGHTVTQIPFVFKDENFREGCSPDGFVTDKKGAEIKCPYNSENYIKFLVNDTIKADYEKQCQFTLRIVEADEWDFVQFDPRMRKSPMKIVTVERDLKMQKTFDDAVPQFISDMDKMLEKIGIKFGEQWS